MAHKKGMGSSKNGRASKPKMLGVKRYDGHSIKAWTILVRQRGTKVHPGENVRKVSDDTLFSLIDCKVKFSRKGKNQKQVSVIPN